MIILLALILMILHSEDFIMDFVSSDSVLLEMPCFTKHSFQDLENLEKLLFPIMISRFLFISQKIIYIWGQSPCYSSKGPMFDSQHLQDRPQLSIIPFRRDLMPSSSLRVHQQSHGIQAYVYSGKTYILLK